MTDTNGHVLLSLAEGQAVSVQYTIDLTSLLQYLKVRPLQVHVDSRVTPCGVYGLSRKWSHT